MPKIVDHEQYRRELLGKSFDLFAQYGFSKVSMRQIAEELGVSTGTLYHYFSNKEAMFQQMFDEMGRHDILNISTQFKEQTSISDPLEFLFDYISKNEAYFVKLLSLLFDFYQNTGSNSDDRVLKRVAENYRRAISELLGIDDPEMGALIFGFINGLVVQRLVDPKKISFKKQVRLFKHMILQYV